MLPKIRFLQLKNFPILNQLQLEEALLRGDEGNWCIINEGSTPAIVFGISGKEAQHINGEALQKKAIVVIRRFSGGGTVVVDENTLFVTFICHTNAIPTLCLCPKKILEWTERFYAPVFKEVDFRLNENDYCIGEKKFGGNAQYLKKDRWLHHSTLLWDFKKEHMDYLLYPPKTPIYRKARSHDQFLTKLIDFYPCKVKLQENIRHQLSTYFTVEEITMDSCESFLNKPHRKVTVELFNATSSS